MSSKLDKFRTTVIQPSYVGPFLGSDMRCEIAYVPPPEDPLSEKVGAWLGGGSRGEAPPAVEGLTAADHSFLTALPRRSGFHATLKPPFTLEDSHSVFELERRLAEFATQLREPMPLTLQIALIDSFFAFVPTHPVPDVARLAAEIVVQFDGFRRPMSQEDLDRRSAARYSPTQLANLAKWGSPFVFDQFHFHMTLTGPVDRNEREHVALVLNRYFGVAPFTVALDRIVLSVQDDTHEPFRIHSAHPFQLVEQKLAS